MLSLDADQEIIVASENKEFFWLFDVDNDANGSIDYNWSTETVSYQGTDYTFKIPSFDGVDTARSGSEIGLQAPNKTSFTVLNSGNSLSGSDFVGGRVTVKRVMSAVIPLRDAEDVIMLDAGGHYLYTRANDETIGQWKFDILRCEPANQTLKFTCEDFLQKIIVGSYPNKKLVSDIWPSDIMPDDNLCLPVPFGTAYIPTRPVYVNNTVSGTTDGTTASHLIDSGADFANDGIVVGMVAHNTTDNTFATVTVVAATDLTLSADIFVSGEGYNFSCKNYYALGSTSYTYTITGVHSPVSTAEWTTATFTQSTQDTYRTFQPLIANGAVGVFNEGSGRILDVPTKFTRSDTVSTTSPADVIEFVLEEMGVPSADIDATSFAAAKSVYSGWSLVFNGAYWYTQPRKKVLAQLLVMCHSYLVVTDKIELHVYSKTSQKTITNADILSSGKDRPSTFRYSSIIEKVSDSGYITWKESGKPQNTFNKALVAAKASTDEISGDTIDCPFVADSQDVQRIASLAFQKKFFKSANISFKSKATLSALQPGDVITINHANYGGSYDVMIDSMKINHDLSIDFKVIKFSIALDDWTDRAPGAISPATDGTTGEFRTVLSGVTSTPDSGDPINYVKDSIVLYTGADITLSSETGSADANRGILKFKLNHTDIHVAGDYDTDTLVFSPTTSGLGQLFMGADWGGSSKPFNAIAGVADTTITFQRISGSNNMRLDLTTDYAGLSCTDGADTSTVRVYPDYIECNCSYLKFTGTMGNSSKDPTTDAPADWVQVDIGGTAYYAPVYAVS